jgi:hypothetical protein
VESIEISELSPEFSNFFDTENNFQQNRLSLDYYNSWSNTVEEIRLKIYAGYFKITKFYVLTQENTEVFRPYDGGSKDL